MKNECKEILRDIGNPIAPQRIIELGEGDQKPYFDASENSFPKNIFFAENRDQAIEEDTTNPWEYEKEKRRYLWVIRENEILLQWEATPSRAKRGCICHTNLTGDGQAIVGGELWFLKEGEDYRVLFNFSSGRYPVAKQMELTNSSLDEMIKKVKYLFNCVGYDKVDLFVN